MLLKSNLAVILSVHSIAQESKMQIFTTNKNITYLEIDNLCKTELFFINFNVEFVLRKNLIDFFNLVQISTLQNFMKTPN